MQRESYKYQSQREYTNNKLLDYVELAAAYAELSLFCAKGIKNGCPCIVEIRGTQGCALVGDPSRAVGECRDVAKAQP